MLERKRRARINRCLDELKELMVSALQSEGENVSKLEKADILELTVRHLHKLRRQQRLSLVNNTGNDHDRFRAGFSQCASEVSRCLAATPGVDVQLGTQLMTHLGHRLNALDKTTPLSVHVDRPTSPTCPSELSPNSYNMPLTPASSETSSTTESTAGLLQVADLALERESVWRPW